MSTAPVGEVRTRSSPVTDHTVPSGATSVCGPASTENAISSPAGVTTEPCEVLGFTTTRPCGPTPAIGSAPSSSSTGDGEPSRRSAVSMAVASPVDGSST